MLNQNFANATTADDYAGGRFLQSIGVRIVHLVRRDVIAQVVSDFSMRAAIESEHMQGGVHKASDAERAKQLAELRIAPTPDEFTHGLREQVLLRREARLVLDHLASEFGVDHIEFAYEDLKGDEGASLLCALKAFLTQGGGLNCGPLLEDKNMTAGSFNNVKIHKDPPSHYVSNWEEVASAIAADPDPELRSLLNPTIGVHNDSAASLSLSRVGPDAFKQCVAT